MILVTGATGHLGGAVIDFLLKKSHRVKVAALVRDKNKAEELSKKGVELRDGDYTNYSSLVEAFKGVEKLGFVSSSELENRVQQHTNVVNAAKEAGVKHIYYTSGVRASVNSKFIPSHDHAKTEEAIKASGLTYTIFRNTFYMDELPGFLANPLKTGKWVFPTNGAKANYASRIDMAEALANAIYDGGHENKVYEITSDKAYTDYEIAEIVSKVTGKELKYTDVPLSKFIEGLKKASLPEATITMIKSVSGAIRDGELDIVDDSLEKLLGRKPQSMEDFLKKALVSS